MLLDEAIKHCEEVVDEKLYEVQDCLEVHDMENARDCDKCAEYHKQLAGWLKELKRLKEQETCEDAVSRKDVFDMIEQIEDAGGFIGYNTYSEAFDRVDNMPTVRPVSCIATVTFNKEDMQKIVDEKVKELVLENAR